MAGSIEPTYVIAGGVLLLLLAIGISYNRFVTQRNLIESSWSNIDTELRRRYDLIPNLVETVKAYAAHEQAVLHQVTVARTGAVRATGSPADQARAETPLVAALRQLMAVAENYPQLKASTHFLALQNQLTHTEDRIQAARRFYNSNVQGYNRRIGSIPSNLIAAIFGFKLAEYFEIEPAMRPVMEAAPQVKY
ncbi:MAG TPA: LemA family protein [Actinomycetota bacterium]|nr:LemA family protein [Actinomycetota bacterium]